jgi:hypothetical protein
MRPIAALMLALASLSLGSAAWARHSGSSSSHNTASHHTSHPRTAPGVARDHRGHILRSSSARKAFEHSHPCPSTGRTRGRCPGYVIDHVQALRHGGADSPSNMQWQTSSAAKAKDKVE